MAKESSIAPKERINIVYKPTTNANEEVELPLKMLMMGDYTLRQDERLIEDRKPISIDKDNFNEVMAAQELSLQMNVPNKLEKPQQETNDLSVRLQIKSIHDFEPDGIAEQVPELSKLLKIREALVSLKGPLGNVPAFRKRLQSIVKDPETLQKLYQELGLQDSQQIQE